MTDTSSNFFAVLRDIREILARAASYGMDAVASVSWTNLAIACVALAIVLTVVPLAIGLFLAFVAVKLVLGAVRERRRGKAVPYNDVPAAKDEER